MDDSVIVLDDSQNSVEIVENDVEDGELEEDIEFIPPENATPNEVDTSGKSDQNENNASENSQETTSGESDHLVFEVRFRNEEHFSSLQKQMLDVLEATFGDRRLVYRTSPVELAICAFENNETPTEGPSSPDLNTEDLFLIDTKPAEKLNASQVPSYKRGNTDVLDEETETRKRLKAEAVNKCIRPKTQSSCFNCGETDHSLRECPKPRNNARIQRARKKISHRMERYHVDTEQRFGHIRPGRIGTKTRHALGYSRGELPFIFYRMRVLGYPPAWLEEAKVQSSGIALFNADVRWQPLAINISSNAFALLQGTEVTKSDDEDGESDTFKYDVNKIVEFPGFNVHPGEKCFDDFKHHNVPPYQVSNSKEHFIKSLGENVINGYRRKKLLDLPAPHDKLPTPAERQTTFGDCDMEVVDEAEDPPLPPSEAAPPPPPPEDKLKARPSSPTLEDLRAQQEKLLQQLEGNTSLNTTANESQSVIDLDSTAEVDPAEPPVKSSLATTSQSTSSTPRATAQPFKASFEGTPVLKFSIYDKLPVGSKFQEGISDVINFENLPDSTGKYEQMKGLLKSVREKIMKLQNEDN
ncbi:hypothetical protein KR009_009136 [Drosophila setifemur]|nr:hypothetical protein KR009_009136 [Drosophila setifemur]